MVIKWLISFVPPIANHIEGYTRGLQKITNTTKYYALHSTERWVRLPSVIFNGDGTALFPHLAHSLGFYMHARGQYLYGES